MKLRSTDQAPDVQLVKPGQSSLFVAADMDNLYLFFVVACAAVVPEEEHTRK